MYTGEDGESKIAQSTPNLKGDIDIKDRVILRMLSMSKVSYIFCEHLLLV
jgi:hypothetical protein